MHYYGTSSINEKGHLTIGGVDTIDLANEFGTPLYVYDTQLIRERARGFKNTFEKLGVSSQVAYASKAFSSIAMIQLIAQEGLSLDVVSGGELYTALKAGFNPDKIHFHGNNKSPEEISMALDADIGCFVVDNFYEIELLSRICKEKGKIASILLRVTPGIEAHTHDYILTGQEDSKFGFDLQNGQAEEALNIVLGDNRFNVLGLHCHIGSQIFETTGFIMAAEKMIEKMSEWKTSLNFKAEVLNLGGGFGIRYTKEDEPLAPGKYVEDIITKVKILMEEHQLTMPEIWIEPGRSLTGDAGTTLYKTGSTKHVPDVRNYLAVDGGMSDNIRPALYNARYEAVIANRPEAEAESVVSIAGKCCESGDMLIWDLPICNHEPGDVLAVFCTGAYGYAMANNYNRIPRPAVVFVENGRAELVIERESYEDLIRHDLPLTLSGAEKE
ncbi:diaminopimelate decarboxylase [Jeotgalibacillus haloalkalitolerans]|uniref:Diaminopimelate decarboxylase n=1 Tax=Jeotgalibacillus haloalkalitolerans TaxID=3104292 RepID=A0ABU5KLB3_9BACL|nr:diaminopimelate decarboxylase [Jeotgalibacillus sp. HH7-29]MDZ5712057.1 diaminopimelate decarboxylase [Jeotgalibacillus sp. HH7-29]